MKERVGGIHGCSHITELVMCLPTAALQTFASDVQDNADGNGLGHKPFQLDRCHALESHSGSGTALLPALVPRPENQVGHPPAHSLLQPQLSKESA